MKKALLCLIFSFGIVALSFNPSFAGEQKQEQSLGEAIGSSARQVADDSTATYHDAKAAVIKMSDDVARDAKKVFQDTKSAGEQVAKDVKSGYHKEKSADKEDQSNAKKQKSEAPDKGGN